MYSRMIIFELEENWTENILLDFVYGTSIVGALTRMRVRQSNSELGRGEVQPQSGWWTLQTFVYSLKALLHWNEPRGPIPVSLHYS